MINQVIIVGYLLLVMLTQEAQFRVFWFVLMANVYGLVMLFSEVEKWHTYDRRWEQQLSYS